MVKVHAVIEKFKADIGSLIFAQDVESKASQFGKDVGVGMNLVVFAAALGFIFSLMLKPP